MSPRATARQNISTRGTLMLAMTQISWRAPRQYIQGTDALAESIRHRLAATLEPSFSRTAAIFRLWPADCFAIPRSFRTGATI
jgi:hypothetical protein